LGSQKETLQQRGDKLNEMANKSESLSNQAHTFADLATELRKRNQEEADLTCVVS